MITRLLRTEYTAHCRSTGVVFQAACHPIRSREMLFGGGGYEILIIAAIAFLMFGVPLIAVIAVVVVTNRRNRQADPVDDPRTVRQEAVPDERPGDGAVVDE